MGMYWLYIPLTNINDFDGIAFEHLFAGVILYDRKKFIEASNHFMKAIQKDPFEIMCCSEMVILDNVCNTMFNKSLIIITCDELIELLTFQSKLESLN